MTAKAKTSPKYVVWWVVLGIGILGGLLTAYKVLTQGLSILGANDIVTWTLPISIYVFFALTSTGLTFVASMPLVFGLKQFNSIAKRAILLAIAALFAAFTALSMDLGSISNLVKFITSPNFSSPMWWMGAFYALELAMLLIKFWRMHVGDWASMTSKVVGIVGFVSAIAASVTLGMVFGTVEARPAYFSGFVPVFFLVTAFLSGLAFFMLASLLYYYFSQKNLSDEQIVQYNVLGKILGFAAGFVLVLFVVRTITGLASTGTEFLAFDHSVGKLPFQIVLWLGLVIPTLLMLIPSVRSTMIGKLIASALVLLGLFFERVDYVTVGQLKPVGVKAVGMPELVGHSSTVWEWLILIAAIAILLLLFTIGEKYLKLESAD